MKTLFSTALAFSLLAFAQPAEAVADSNCQNLRRAARTACIMDARSAALKNRTRPDYQEVRKAIRNQNFRNRRSDLADRGIRAYDTSRIDMMNRLDQRRVLRSRTLDEFSNRHTTNSQRKADVVTQRNLQLRNRIRDLGTAGYLTRDQATLRSDRLRMDVQSNRHALRALRVTCYKKPFGAERNQCLAGLRDIVR